jgi:single stranded DNA-binding protein
MRTHATINLIGRIASDLTESSVGERTVVNFRVAVDRRKKKDATEKPETDFHSVSVWGKNGTNCKTHLIKGQIVEIRGRLHNRVVRKDADRQTTYTQIVADEVNFGPKPMKKAA